MTWVVALIIAATTSRGRAEQAPPAPAGSAPEAPPSIEPPAPELRADSEFGPVILIEAIEITGNTATHVELIRSALPLSPGDVLHASDKRLREARYKVLALGFFRDVTLAMRKGSARGQVILEVQVVERGTIVLNRLWFGTNPLTPWWAGADVSERNLLGLGVSVGGGLIYAQHGEVAGARQQWAGELRVADPSMRGSRWGANAAFTFVHGSEAYRVSGEPSSSDTIDHRAYPFRRIGGRAGVTFNASALSRVSASVRGEQILATLPVAPTRIEPDGRVTAIDLHLQPGSSRVMTAGVMFDRDARPDVILPHSGSRFSASAELGSSLIGGNYEFVTLLGRFERYWPLFEMRHAIGLKLAGGVVIGNAPQFERIHIADVNRMLTPRALGLVLSAAAPLDLLSTRPDKPSYGDMGGSATVEYAFRLFRGSGTRRVYGGDVFFGIGVWGLGEVDDLRARDASLVDSLPIDLYVDAGLRIDTDLGIFELTVANALGRVR